MPIKNNREYRDVACLKPEKRESGEKSFIVEGYASTFDEYVLYEGDDGVQYKERIDRDAFTGTDIDDVIMQYDHQGMVYARTSNGTLTVSTDDHGLKIRADLSSTTQSRELYEAIASGLITKMSFAFTVGEDDYDSSTKTRTVKKVRKLYDVSAVSYPANPGTEIGLSARDVFDGLIEGKKQELLKAEQERQRIQRLKLKIKISEAFL